MLILCTSTIMTAIHISSLIIIISVIITATITDNKNIAAGTRQSPRQQELPAGW